jgi:hypothetical protein
MRTSDFREYLGTLTTDYEVYRNALMWKKDDLKA